MVFDSADGNGLHLVFSDDSSQKSPDALFDEWFDPRFTVPGAEDDVVMQRCEGVGHKSQGVEQSNAHLVFKRRYATHHDSIREAPSLERLGYPQMPLRGKRAPRNARRTVAVAFVRLSVPESGTSFVQKPNRGAMPRR